MTPEARNRHREYYREYRKRHPEQIRETNRRYRQRHRTKVLARQRIQNRLYRERHPERYKTLKRQEYHRHRDHYIRMATKWRKTHRELYNQRQRKYARMKLRSSQQYRDMRKRICKKSYWKHREKKLAYFAIRNKTLKAWARQQVDNAIDRKDLIRPNECPRCHRTDEKIEAHHYKGYDRPLDIIWLCKICHAEAHFVYPV